MAGGVFSSALLYGMTIRESANDGSDFTNPAADYRRLFLGEDGTLKLKDSAGTVTTPSASSGAVTASGLTMATARILGRTTASTGAVEEITVGTGLSLSGGSLTATGAAGGLVLLEQQTASASATLDFTTAISATYDEYLIEGVGIRPATDGTNLIMRMGTSGPSYDAGANYFGTLRTGVGTSGTPAGAGSSNGATTQADAGGSAIMVAEVIDNDAAFGQCSFTLRLTNPQSTAKHKHIFGTVVWHNGTEVFMAMCGYLWASTSAAVAFRFLMAAGNITSGVIRAYGIAKS